jgi:predicted acetyltransferase
MEVNIELFSSSEKQLLQNLNQAYRHDMSEFNGDDPDENGMFNIGTYFHEYWIEPQRHPFKILNKNILAGFALVREFSEGQYSIAEFFILRKHRRNGIGRKAAFKIFDKFDCIWHVAQDEFNTSSQEFWKDTINEYTGSNYENSWSEAEPRGPKQVFRTARCV